MNKIWIESMNSFEPQCFTEGLQIDNVIYKDSITIGQKK